jgi:hypothetical protein
MKENATFCRTDDLQTLRTSIDLKPRQLTASEPETGYKTSGGEGERFGAVPLLHERMHLISLAGLSQVSNDAQACHPTTGHVVD